MNRITPAAVASTLVLLASEAGANNFTAVNDRETFLDLVEGRELRLGALGISLEISPEGQIEGRAAGWNVVGTWTWQDGYFCREMDWSGTEIPYNCQLVEVAGDGQIRFTVDQGAGDSATLNLR